METHGAHHGRRARAPAGDSRRAAGADRRGRSAPRRRSPSSRSPRRTSCAAAASCPPRSTGCARAFPVVSHGLMMSLGGIDPFDDAYFAELRRYLARIGAPFHSDHLSFSGTGGRILHDLLPLPLSRAAARHAAARAREAQSGWRCPSRWRTSPTTSSPARPSAGRGRLHRRRAGRERRGAAPRREQRLRQRAELRLRRASRSWSASRSERVVEIHVAGHERFEEDELIIDTHGAPVVDPVLGSARAGRWRAPGPCRCCWSATTPCPSVAELCAELVAHRGGVPARARAHRRGEEPCSLMPT